MTIRCETVICLVVHEDDISNPVMYRVMQAVPEEIPVPLPDGTRMLAPVEHRIARPGPASGELVISAEDGTAGGDGRDCIVDLEADTVCDVEHLPWRRFLLNPPPESIEVLETSGGFDAMSLPAGTARVRFGPAVMDMQIPQDRMLACLTGSDGEPIPPTPEAVQEEYGQQMHAWLMENVYAPSWAHVTAPSSDGVVYVTPFLPMAFLAQAMELACVTEEEYFASLPGTPVATDGPPPDES